MSMITIPNGFWLVACSRCGVLRLTWKGHVSDEPYDEERGIYDAGECPACREGYTVHILVKG